MVFEIMKIDFWFFRAPVLGFLLSAFGPSVSILAQVTT